MNKLLEEEVRYQEEQASAKKDAKSDNGGNNGKNGASSQNGTGAAALPSHTDIRKQFEQNSTPSKGTSDANSISSTPSRPKGSEPPPASGSVRKVLDMNVSTPSRRAMDVPSLTPRGTRTSDATAMGTNGQTSGDAVARKLMDDRGDAQGQSSAAKNDNTANKASHTKSSAVEAPTVANRPVKPLNLAAITRAPSSETAKKAPSKDAAANPSAKPPLKSSNSDVSNSKVAADSDMGIVAFVGHGDKLGLGLQQKKGGGVTVLAVAEDGTARKCNYIWCACDCVHVYLLLWHLHLCFCVCV